jgi:hypothetical protein
MSWFSSAVRSVIGGGGGGGGDNGAAAAAQAKALQDLLEQQRAAAAAQAAAQAEAARKAQIAAENESSINRQNAANIAGSQFLGNLAAQQAGIDATAKQNAQSSAGSAAAPITSDYTTPAVIGSYGGTANPKLNVAQLLQQEQQDSSTANTNKFTMPNTAGLTFGGK